jgi:hypothetical protein
MYVPQGSVPRNSMTPPDPKTGARYRARIMRTDQQATRAFLAVECPPSPVSFPDQSSNVLAQVAIAQARGILPGIAAGPAGLSTTGGGTTSAANPVPTPAEVQAANAAAPVVVPLNGGAPTPGCQVQFRPYNPPKTPQPVQLRPAPGLVKSTQQLIVAPILPAPAPPVAPALIAPATAAPPPPSNPCGPGLQFLGYRGGILTCSAGSGGVAPAAGGWAHAYAGIAGLGDVPGWGDAYAGGCSPGLVSSGSKWWWLAAAAAGLAILGTRKRR